MLGWLTTLATALFAVNTAAEIGGKVQRGVRSGRERRARRRIQASPPRAARWLTAELRQAGHPVEVKPGMIGQQWFLVATYPVGSSLQPPLEFEGYTVVRREPRRH